MRKQSWKNVQERLRQEILHGKYRTGEPLPPVRALAERCGISPVTLLKALDGLRDSGLIEIVRGVGCFVTDVWTRETQSGSAEYHVVLIHQDCQVSRYEADSSADYFYHLFDYWYDDFKSIAKDHNWNVRIIRLDRKIPDFETLSRKCGSCNAVVTNILLPDFVHSLRKLNRDLVVISPAGQLYLDGAHGMICCDHRQMTRLAVNYLIDRGCRRLALFSGLSRNAAYQVRESTFRETVGEAGLPLHETLCFHCGERSSEVSAVVREIISLPPEERPDGVFCCNDFRAVSLVRELQSNYLFMEVVGFDGSPAALGMGIPTVVLPLHEAGRAAFHLLHGLRLGFYPVPITLVCQGNIQTGIGRPSVGSSPTRDR